tara:strand:- start:47 stop:253 length:207 start_codon:yes stop_codon:yes gene_type:complete
MNNDQINSTPFPSISEALLKELNNRFPEACPELDWDEKTVWYATGQRSVIRLLNTIFEEQQQNLLGGK